MNPSKGKLLPKKVTSVVERIAKISPAVRAQFEPDERELSGPGYHDPLGEQNNSPLPRLIRSYRDRCVVIVTEYCPVFCRFCNRRRFYGSKESIKREEFLKILDYLKKESIYEVIISGGEPFTVDTETLGSLIEGIKRAGVRVVRISTRALFTIPERINEEVADMLSEFSPVWLVLHINHPDEITPEFESALRVIRRSGSPLLSQTVLLRGINDKSDVLEKLFRKLVEMGIKPYYLYQCDEVKGASHFKVPLPEALKIMEKLRKNASGLCIPYFVVDGRGGAGKVPLVPEAIIEKEKNHWKLKSPKGIEFIYEF